MLLETVNNCVCSRRTNGISAGPVRERVVDGENVGVALLCFWKWTHHVDCDTIHRSQRNLVYVIRLMLGYNTFSSQALDMPPAIA